MSEALSNWALLLLALAVIAAILRRGRAGYLAFAAAAPDKRPAYYRQIILNQLLFFAAPALLALSMLGRWETLDYVPVELWPVITWLGVDPPFGDPAITTFFLGCGAVGLGLGASINWFRARSGWVRKPPLSLETTAIVPRSRHELAYGVGVSFAAGACEELFFRVMLPILLCGVGANPWVAALLSCGVFGLVHLYQKWVGVIVTAAVGLLLMYLYLMTGSLLLVMALHVAIDLSALVVRPALAGAWRTSGRV